MNKHQSLPEASRISSEHDGLLRERRAYRPDIDGLRAVSVVAVVIYHAGLGLSGGFTGVDIFFVISGFLITSLIVGEIDGRKFSIIKFYERRARRILPALCCMFVASAVAAWVLFLPPEFSLFGHSMMLAALFVSNIGFWQEAGYFDTITQFKPLLHTWSLGVEEQFYIIFPVLLAIVVRYFAGWRFSIIAFLTVASFAISVIWTFRAPDAAFFLLPGRFWELGIGSLLALAPSLKLTKSNFATAIGVVGVLLLVIGFAAISERTAFPGAAALLPCVGCVFIIIAGSCPNPISALLSWRPLVFIGLISYPLYLWHWPVFVFTQYRSGHLLTLGEAIAAIAASVFLAFVTWRFIEFPIRRRLLLPTAYSLFSAVSATTVVVIILGLTVSLGNGWPGRLPKDVQQVYAAKLDLSQFSKPTCLANNNGTGGTPESVRRGDLCAMGADVSDPPEFLVWGDSHAGAMAPAIDLAAKNQGKRGLFAGHGSCPPLINYTLPSSQLWKHRKCQEGNNAVLDLVKQRRIPLVFLIGRWPYEVLGTKNGQEGPFYDPSASYSVQDRSTIVASALDSTISALVKIGARPVLVTDVPEPGYDVPIFLARAALAKTVAPINPTRAAVYARQTPALNVLQKAAAKWNISIVDTLPYFCDDQICRVQHGGVSLYRDANHITQSTALSLAYFFEDSFSRR